MEELVEFFEVLRVRVNELLYVINSLDPSDVNKKQLSRFLQNQNILKALEQLEKNLTSSTKCSTRQTAESMKNAFYHSETLTHSKNEALDDQVYVWENRSVRWGEKCERKEEKEEDISESANQLNGNIPRKAADEISGLDEENESTSDTESVVGENVQSQRTWSRTTRNQCALCAKSFKFHSLLKKHLKTHMDSKEHLCGTCGKSYKTASTLKEHLRIHTGEKPFVCSICGKTFRQAGVRMAHERAHQSDQQYNCCICDKSYKNKCSLNVHMSKHSGDKCFKCSQCNKAFSQQQTLTVHLRTHSGDRPFLCNVCGKSFSAAATFRKHKFSHQLTTPYQCEGCGKYFTTITKLKCHALTHKKRLFVCEFCKGKFRSEIHLKNHAAKCEINKQELTRKGTPRSNESKRNHSKIYGDRERRKGKRKMVELDQHKDRNQSVVGQEDSTESRKNQSQYLYKCVKCGSNFSVEEALNKHQLTCVAQSMRSDITVPCSCSSCGSQFLIMSDLLNHLTECYPSKSMNTTGYPSVGHQNMQPGFAHEQTLHKCYECKTRFNSIEDLERHHEFCFQSKSIDLSNVPYKCACCGHLCESMEELSKHENVCRMEQDNASISCENCLQIFSKMELLSAHQAVCLKTFAADKLNSVKCSECDVLFNSQEDFEAHRDDCVRISHIDLSYHANNQPRDLHLY